MNSTFRNWLKDARTKLFVCFFGFLGWIAISVLVSKVWNDNVGAKVFVAPFLFGMVTIGFVIIWELVAEARDAWRDVKAGKKPKTIKYP